MMPPLRHLLILPLLLTPALAQRGDRAGEVQAPPPAHIKIPPAPVLTPAEALRTFKLPPGFRIEAVATDPLLGDPISIQFGPDGRLWVLEMRGFMPDADGNNERDPVCVVAVLEDTDGDGRYDKRTVFADKLVLPRAISLVGDGLLVAEPPKLWFLRDTNGDGVADEKTEIAADYGNITNPEHNANGLLWAMDNWIYSANHTVRFRYEGGAKFARDNTITRGQWGITQDDTGRLYYNSNSDPLRLDAVPSAYLKRNAAFTASGTNVQLVPANLRVWPGRVTPGINRGYNTLDAEGKLTAVTAACGPVIYRGALFPAEFRGDAFIAEPSGNLIKRIKLSEADGTVRGANAYDGTEFLTSTDERFRPVNLFNGPDGALYVVDLYRGILQHRIYVTSFLRKQIDERGLAEGRGLGRIWRIAPEGAPRANFKAVALARASSPELVAKLADANGWVRDTAQRLLVERRDPAAVPLLTGLARTAGDPLGRLHALWTLDGLGAADKATLLPLLDDRDPRVCAAAIRIAEKFLKPAPDAAVLARLTALTPRADPAVRLQLALSLGEAKTPEADAALRALARAAGREPFVADAIVSGLAGREADFVAALVSAPDAGQAADVVRLATSAAMKSGKAPQIDRVLALLLAKTTQAWGRTEILAGVKHFLPKGSGFGGPASAGAGRGAPPGGGRGGRGGGERLFAAALTAEPKPLVAFAAQATGAEATAANELLKYLKWPGKPGAEASEARPLTAGEQKQFELGKAQFAAVCAACHQPNGQGLAGLAPSLVYSRWVLGDPRVLARIVLNGKTQENLIMPPWKAALDDSQVAGLLTFLRRSWGHDADPITPDVVAEARQDTASRAVPYSDADLEELVRSLPPQRRPRAR